jgi:membrane-bound ClpP family serine protease
MKPTTKRKLSRILDSLILTSFLSLGILFLVELRVYSKVFSGLIGFIILLFGIDNIRRNDENAN